MDKKTDKISIMTLTLDHDVIGISGITRLSQGTTVNVVKVIKREEFWGKRSGVYYPEKITGYVIEGFEESIFLPQVFKETKP